MKLILDWDEDTVDLVIIAVGSYLCDAQETWNEMQEFNPPSPELSALYREAAGRLSRALNDLAPAEDEDGIYPVRELLGSHEARLLKEEL
jgi:hypothetical protein